MAGRFDWRILILALLGWDEPGNCSFERIVEDALYFRQMENCQSFNPLPRLLARKLPPLVNHPENQSPTPSSDPSG